jgi:hypothetical protein
MGAAGAGFSIPNNHCNRQGGRHCAAPSLLASNEQTLALLTVRRCRALRLPEAPVAPAPDRSLSFELAHPHRIFIFVGIKMMSLLHFEDREWITGSFEVRR